MFLSRSGGSEPTPRFVGNVRLVPDRRNLSGHRFDDAVRLNGFAAIIGEGAASPRGCSHRLSRRTNTLY